MSLPPSNRPSRNVSRYLPRPMLSLSLLIVWLAITNAASLGLFLLGQDVDVPAGELGGKPHVFLAM